MRIGVVTPGGFDRTGVERTIPVFNWIVKRLAQRHTVRVFTLYQEPRPSVFHLLGATIENVGRSPRPLASARTAWSAVRAIERAHAAAPFDVLHGLWATESGEAAVVAGRRLGIPSVVSVLGGEAARLPEIGYGMQRRWSGRLRFRRVIRGATVVTTNSRFIYRRLERIRPDCEVIYNGVDTTQFTPAASAPAGPHWRLLHVGSLNRVKDQTTLLRAFQRIRDAEPRATLDIVGEDTLNGAVQRLAAELGVADAVSFHGFQPSAVVAAMMREAHLLLHSSLYESGPVVMAEAAAMGVPAVGTSVGIMDDLRGDLCAAVPVRDHAALAGAALDLLRDVDRRLALRPRLIQWAREYDAEQTARGWEGAYERAQAAMNPGAAASKPASSAEEG